MSQRAQSLQPAPVKPPRMIDYACLALAAEALAWLLSALVIRLSRASLTTYYFAHVTKKDDSLYAHTGKDAADIHSMVSSDISGSLIQSVLLAAACVFLAYLLRRVRGATAARWSIVIVAVLLRTPLALAAVSGQLPAGLKATQFLIGLTSVASIILLFLPPSRQYFAKVRAEIAAVSPPRPARAGMFGSGGLFGNRRPAAGTTTDDATAPRRVELSKRRTGGDTVPLPAATAGRRRDDAAAVAKGAALARSRAKAAAKSRRSED